MGQSAAISDFRDVFVSILSPEAKEFLIKTFRSDFSQYQNDPVGFVRDILHEEITDDVKRMMESVRDNPVTVAISANAVGKTHGAARTAVWFFLCFRESKVFTAAAPPLDNLKTLLWGEIGSVVGKHPELFETSTCTSMHIERNPEQFLTGVTIPSAGTDQEREAKFSGKHQEHMLFIFDEGDAIPDPPYKGAESCMSGGHFRQLIMFNPRQTSGAVYRMIRDNQAHVVHLSAFNHPNVLTGRNVIPGAVDRETTVRRINEWARLKHPQEKVEADSLFVLPDFLVGCVAQRKGAGQYPPLKGGEYVITNPALSYMVLGRYPAQGSNQLISMDWVNAARSRWDAYVAQHGEVPPRGVSGIMGLDCAEFGDDFNVAIARYGGYVTRPQAGVDVWSGVDMLQTGQKAAAWYHTHPCISMVMVDATGVGAGVAPHMVTLGCSAFSVKGAKKPTYAIEEGEFRHLRDELWWSLREWLRTDIGAMLPPDEEMIEELVAATYEIKEGKIVVTNQDDLKKILGRSPNRADALRQTFAKGHRFFDGCVFNDYPPKQAVA